MYDKLYPFTQVEESVKKQHIESIQILSDPRMQRINGRVEIIEQTNNEVKEKIRPKCGNKMVLRTAQKGQYAGRPFWGCANYPKCRHIQNVD